MTAPFHPSIPARRWLLLAFLVMTAACGGSSSPTQEAPRAALTGHLHAASSGAPQGALRLALAWYPGLLSEDGTLSQPGAIQPQDVAYSGTLPQAYAFELDQAPPASALRPLPEGWAGQGAIGILLAYQDGNANHRLDVITADGSPIDRVVGASLEWTASPAFVVMYLTAEQPAASGLHAGFNLVRIDGAEDSTVVPLTTPVPLSVSQGGALLDLFVCEAAWDGSSTPAPCGLQPEEDPVALEAQVEGEVYVGVMRGEAAFRLVEQVNGQPAVVKDATVTLDGAELPYDPESGYYRSAELDLSHFTVARKIELVATRGQVELRRPVLVPAFDFTYVPSTVAPGTFFDVSWSVPSSAASFDLGFFSDPTHFQNVYGLSGPTYRVAPLGVEGEARLTVAAHGLGEIPVTVVRSTIVKIAAPPDRSIP